MDINFVPQGKSAVLIIEGFPAIEFVLLSVQANREVYQAGIDNQGYYIYEQVENTDIKLTVRNIVKRYTPNA